jgi:hypothetical protein
MSQTVYSTMDSELVNESPQTCPSTPPPQTGSGNTTEGDEAAKTETKVAIPIPPNPDTKGFGEDSLRLQIAEYLRKHGHDKFHEIFSQAIETTQPSLEDKIIVDEDAMSRIAENIGPYAVQSGLKDLETLVSLETRSWVHPGVCRCYSCEAKKGNEKSIFQWVSGYFMDGLSCYSQHSAGRFSQGILSLITRAMLEDCIQQVRERARRAKCAVRSSQQCRAAQFKWSRGEERARHCHYFCARIGSQNRPNGRLRGRRGQFPRV